MDNLDLEKRYKNNELKKKKFNFNELKDNTLCSLNSVEYFLNNFNTACKYFKVFKILK